MMVIEDSCIMTLTGSEHTAAAARIHFALSMLTSLDESTRRALCSGQVVHSVPSCIKELLENSLDAGATTVEVRLEQQGLELIQVKDNGSGIEQVDECATGYKTSKLDSFAGLERVTTYGFRGEALHSICAVSHQVVIVTRTASMSVGVRVVLDETGSVVTSSPTATSVGTIVSVHGIFKRFPVRLKVSREQAVSTTADRISTKVLHMIEEYSIACPAVRFHYLLGSKASLRKLSMKSELDVMCCLYGPQSMKDATCFSYDSQSDPFPPTSSSASASASASSLPDEQQQQGDVKIRVYLSSCPSSAKDGIAQRSRSNAEHFHIIVNRRPVDAPELLKVVLKSWRRHYEIDTKRYPIGCVVLEIPPEHLDVNVSVSKRTVYLHQSTSVSSLLEMCLHDMFERMQQPASSSSSNIHLGSMRESHVEASVDGVDATQQQQAATVDVDSRLTSAANTQPISSAVLEQIDCISSPSLVPPSSPLFTDDPTADGGNDVSSSSSSHSKRKATDLTGSSSDDFFSPRHKPKTATTNSTNSTNSTASSSSSSREQFESMLSAEQTDHMASMLPSVTQFLVHTDTNSTHQQQQQHGGDTDPNTLVRMVQMLAGQQQQLCLVVDEQCRLHVLNRYELHALELYNRMNDTYVFDCHRFSVAHSFTQKMVQLLAELNRDSNDQWDRLLSTILYNNGLCIDYRAGLWLGAPSILLDQFHQQHLEGFLDELFQHRQQHGLAGITQCRPKLCAEFLRRESYRVSKNKCSQQQQQFSSQPDCPTTDSFTLVPSRFLYTFATIEDLHGSHQESVSS